MTVLDQHREFGKARTVWEAAALEKAMYRWDKALETLEDLESEGG